MKKVLAFLTGMLLVPFTAFGMQVMDEAAMDTITGQSGVAIQLDNIQLFTNEGGTELWYETSTDTADSAAAVGLVYGESPTYLFINKIVNPGNLGDTAEDGFGSSVGTDNDLLRGDYSALEDAEPLADGIENKGPRQNTSVLSIRVSQHGEFGVFGEADTGTSMENGAYIEIGLPTLEIYSAEGSADEMRIFVLGQAAYDTSGSPVGSGTDNHAYSMGSVYTTDSGATTSILGGRVGITSLGQIPQADTSSSLGDSLTEADPWN